MNKKLIVLGTLFATVFALMAFQAKTKEQQQQEIQAGVQMRLEDLRRQKAQECTDRVLASAQQRFDEEMAARTAAAANAPKGSKNMARPRGPRVDKAPQTNPKTTPTTRDRGDAVKPENNRERNDAVNPQEPGSNRRRGDAVKQGGGN